jgi:hypothetical protein
MRVPYRDHTSRSSDREGGFHEGYRGWSPDSRIILLANTFPVGSPPVVYLLAVVPDHSGASVRDLHPLPNSSTSIAVTAKVDIATITRHHRSQAHCDTGGEGIFGTLASPLRHMTRREYREAYNASNRQPPLRSRRIVLITDTITPGKLSPGSGLSPSFGPIDHVCYGQFTIPVGTSIAMTFWDIHLREATKPASGQSHVESRASMGKQS